MDAATVLCERGDAALARLVEAADQARRNLTEEQFWEDNQRLLDRAYTRAATPQGGSGFSGTADEWRAERSIIGDAIDRDGTFLDVGCANGHLLECVERWSAERGVRVTSHGLDISPTLTDLARTRLPHAAERIWTGNALRWVAPEGRQFDFVHTLLDLVPAPRRPELIDHLLRTVVAPGGRLIVSQYISADTAFAAANVLHNLGYHVDGLTSAPNLPGRSPGAPSAWITKPDGGPTCNNRQPVRPPA